MQLHMDSWLILNMFKEHIIMQHTMNVKLLHPVGLRDIVFTIV